MIAAQSIGEPGTQLTMRTFHIGGAASRAAVAIQRGRQVRRHGRFTAHDALRHQRQGRAGRDLAFRRDHDHRRPRPRARAPQGALRRDPDRQADGKPVKAGTVLANWDPHDPPDHHRVRRHGEVRERRGRRRRWPSRSTRSPGLSTLVVIDPKRRGSASQGRASAGQAARRSGRGGQDRRHRSLGDHRLPGRLAHHGAGRPAGARGRSAGAHPAGSAEDARHHRRSAAGGGAVRSAFAQGRGHAGRSHRHGRRSARRPRASSAW